MSTCATASTAGSEVIVQGPSRSDFRIVMELSASAASAIVASEHAMRLLESIWSGIKEGGPDRVLRGLLGGSIFVAAASLVGMAMRKLWSRISIENISSGSVIYSVSIAATEIEWLKELVQSGKMKDQVNEYLKDPKGLLESFNVPKTYLDKAMETLPGNVKISKVELFSRSEDGDAKEDSSSSSRVEVYGLKIKGTATVGGVGCYFDNREGAAANLEPVTIPRSLESSSKDREKRDIIFRDSEVGGKFHEEPKNFYFDNKKSETAGDGKVIKIKVIGLGETFAQDFSTGDLVNDIVSALKKEKKTEKTIRLQVAKTHQPLELYQKLEEAGLEGNPVLEAFED